MSSKEAEAVGLLGDDPRDGSPERPDLLGRGEFVAYLAELLESVRGQSQSSVMALIGDWGSGKSSILELLRQHVSGRDDSVPWLVAEFNPWSYPDAPSLQRGFFAELLAVLPKGDRPSGARAKVGELAKSVSPLGKVAAVVGVDAEGILSAAGDLLIGDKSASASKRAAETALRRTRKPILMVIDDLDRLTPDELLAVLKLVRLVGRLPHVYYLLCYDEQTLLDVLAETPLARGGNADRGRAYLEKIVQVRLDMPVLRASQRAALLNSGLKSILETSRLELEPSDRARLSEMYDAVLDRRLSTPRAISRFLGQVQAFYPPLRGEVDFVDFFLVSLLRTQEPGVYRMLHDERDALLGRSLGAWHPGRDAAAAQARKAFWEGRLASAHVADADMDGVIRLLAELFPHVRAAFEADNYYASAVEPEMSKGISNKDYFDRYVSFGVPEDDLPDSVVAAALALLAGGASGPALDRLTSELRTTTSRAVRKIDAYRNSGQGVPEVALFRVLATLVEDVTDESTELFANPRRTLERGAATCLVHMPPDAAVDALQRAAATPSGLEFAVTAVLHLHRDANAGFPLLVPKGYDLAPLVEVVAMALERQFGSISSTSTFEPSCMRGYWAWRKFAGDRAEEWLRGQVKSGHWTLIDIVGELVSVGVVSGGNGSHPAIGSLDTDTLDAVFGLDRVLTELSDDIDGAPDFMDSWSTDPTTDNRRRYALSVLKGMRAKPNEGDEN